MNFAELCNRRGPANGCNTAFVDVMKIVTWFPFKFVRDISRCRLSLLDRSWRNTRHQMAIFIFEGSQISDYENLQMAGKTQVGIHQHATRAVNGRSKFLAQRRCGYSRRP